MAPEDSPQLRPWDVSSLWWSTEEVLSHSNFGGVTAKGADVFLDPPQGLPFCNEGVRLSLRWARRRRLTVVKSEITDASSLDFLPSQKAKSWYTVQRPNMLRRQLKTHQRFYSKNKS